MSQQNLKHGMLAALIVVSITLSLLMLGYTESGFAVDVPERESKLIYAGNPIEIQLNSSHHSEITETTLATKASAVTLRVKPGNTPTLTAGPNPQTDVRPNSKTFKLRYRHDHARRLNNNGVVRLPIFKNVGGRRVRFPGMIRNVAIKGGDTVVAPDEAKVFEIRVFGRGKSPNDRLR